MTTKNYSQGVTIEHQEIKFDELQKKFDELKIDYESLSRQQSSTIGKTQLLQDCSTPQVIYFFFLIKLL